jgi:tetratricopeptide (TPR) repeat protein
MDSDNRPDTLAGPPMTSQKKPADPLHAILPLLQRGDFANAISALEKLSRTERSAPVLFNLGLAYSAVHEFSKAADALKMAADLDPEHVPIWSALGAQFGHLRQYPAARDALEHGLQLAPADGLMHQNYAGILAQLGDFEAALTAIRRAYVLLEPNPRTHLALGDLLRQRAKGLPVGEERSELMSESSRVLKDFLDFYPESPPYTERAEEALSAIAAEFLKARGLGGFRPDVFEYIVFALGKFEKMQTHQRNLLLAHIAKVTGDGVDINNPTIRHPLPQWGRDFSGLALVSFLFVGARQLNPEADVGIDFSVEYEAALDFRGRKPN